MEQASFASRVRPIDGFSPRSESFSFIPKYFPYNTEVEIIWEKYLGPQKIMNFFLNIDWNSWNNFCIGHFD
jgi:hypothetical protein